MPRQGGFPTMGGGNMQQMVRQAQKLQAQMDEKLKQLGELEYEATSGGGAVAVKISGKRQILSLTIKPEAVDPEDVELLQDMIIAAVNDALSKIDTMRDEELNKIGNGIGGRF